MDCTKKTLKSPFPYPVVAETSDPENEDKNTQHNADDDSRACTVRLLPIVVWWRACRSTRGRWTAGAGLRSVWCWLLGGDILPMPGSVIEPASRWEREVVKGQVAPETCSSFTLHHQLPRFRRPTHLYVPCPPNIAMVAGCLELLPSVGRVLVPGVHSDRPHVQSIEVVEESRCARLTRL